MKRAAKGHRHGNHVVRGLWILGVVLAGLGALGVMAGERGQSVTGVAEAEATGGDVGVGAVLPLELYAVAVATRGASGDVEVACTTPDVAAAMLGEVVP